MLTSGQIGAAVCRAAALLDKTLPDWFSRVDLAALDMASPTRDVLGQLFGTAGRGLLAVMAANPSVRFSSADNGFFLTAKERRRAQGVRKGWILTDEWVNQIESRRLLAAERN